MLRALAVIAFASFVLVACDTAPRPHLSAAYGSYRRVDNTILFELPDTGGYLVNGTPLDTTRIISLLHEVFDPRPAEFRAAFLRDNPKRPWRDVQFLVTRARVAGVEVFDADRSGWPTPNSYQRVQS